MRFVKLLREGRGVWGVLHGDVVRTLTEPPFEGVRYDGESLPLSGCRLLAPCEATKIVCIGKNYSDHIHEMKSMLDASHTPDRPTLFLKAPNALNAHLGKVHAPDFVGRLDYEGELAVVMKRRARMCRRRRHWTMCWVILASTILPPGMSRRRTASGPAAKIWTALPPRGPSSPTRWTRNT